MQYIKIENLAENLKYINKGDVVYLVSDLMRLAFECRKNGEKFNADLFINALQEAVGEEGTLLIPTFNWDFCKNVDFNINSTKSHVGAIGDIAYKRTDFLRTHHPIYSFAVWGKDAKQLYNAKIETCFGKDSLFAYMFSKNAKALAVGLSPTAGTTFIHYVEECLNVPFRYNKVFTGNIIDENNIASEKSVSMFVRDLQINAQYITELDDIITNLSVNKKQLINNIEFNTVYLRGLFNVVSAEIAYNEARRIYDYDRQEHKLNYTQCQTAMPIEWDFIQRQI